MQTRIPLAAAALALAGALATTLFQPRSEAAAPPGNISASYSGKGSSKNNVIANEEPGKGSFDVQISANQSGNDLTLFITISPPGEEPLVWTLSGFAGGGNFWVSGDVGDGDSVVLAGTAKGVPGKIALKAKGFFLRSTHFSDLKIAVKQSSLPD